ncbi:MAG: Uma2 family endonuclease [Cyanobacteria bacterium P01_F01_bin.53]
MVSTAPVPQNIPTDTWVRATWADYVALVDKNPAYDHGRCYYESGEMCIEMAPLGPSHARDNATLSKVVSLFATLKMIRVAEYVNCTFRKEGMRDAQPDLAFYLGQDTRFPPRNNEPADVDLYGVPQLVIEVAASSLSEDLGTKRLLYERFGVDEYWVVNVSSAQVIAFSVVDGGSGEIRESKVLSDLSIKTVEAALHKSQSEDDGAINRWLIEQFS